MIDPQHPVSPAITSQIRHADVVRALDALRALRSSAMQIKELGRSFEGRSISVVTLGTGPAKVFAWSQMHGNEPTHTAALLDLISFLQRSPDHPTAHSILSGCTLELIVMLNPDGAARYERRNAQGVDINRDALELQTPEGRILKQAIETIRPHFALNLHNQSQRACLGKQPARVAAVSLLVPPIDPDDSQTSEVEQAKQLAGCFVEATRPLCAEMTSRYHAGFMPRCFGEWVQGQKIPTLTIEAGGWTGPSIEHTPLVEIHFHGLIGILDGIAQGTYREMDPAVYDALPVNNQDRLLDVIIRNVRIERGARRPAERGDIGVNFDRMSPDHRTPLDGLIADLGSLSETTGKSEIDGAQLVCLPGQLKTAADVTPLALPNSERASALLSRGVTAVIGAVDLADDRSLEALADLDNALPTPIHVGFFGELSRIVELPLAQSQARLIRGIALGVLGVVAETIPQELERIVNWFGLAVAPPTVFASSTELQLTSEAWPEEASQHAEQLNVPGSCHVAMGQRADLVLLVDGGQPSEQPVDWSNLRQVMVAGNVVWKDGQLQMNQGGSLLASEVRRRAKRSV